MMKTVVITDTPFSDNEAEMIRIILSEGIDRVHIRKPGSSESDFRRLIEAIPERFYPAVTLQDHVGLAVGYGIGGVHLNSRNPSVPAGFKGKVSRSCHSLEEVARYASQTDYHFLSPIFDSISKQGYRSGFDMAQLRQAACEGILTRKTIALGGVSADKLPLLHDIGFGGAAFLGDIWHNYHSAADLPALLSHFDRLMRICEEITSSDER